MLGFNLGLLLILLVKSSLFDAIDGFPALKVKLVVKLVLQLSGIRLLRLAALVLGIASVDCFSNDLLLSDEDLRFAEECEVNFHDCDAMLLVEHDLEEHFLAYQVNIQLLETNYLVFFVHVRHDNRMLLCIVALDLD